MNKIDHNEAAVIQRLHKLRWPMRRIARTFGVSKTQVHRIIHGRRTDPNRKKMLDKRRLAYTHA